MNDLIINLQSIAQDMLTALGNNPHPELQSAKRAWEQIAQPEQPYHVTDNSHECKGNS